MIHNVHSTVYVFLLRVYPYSHMEVEVFFAFPLSSEVFDHPERPSMHYHHRVDLLLAGLDVWNC